MASTRELWVLLRARDQASKVVAGFAKNLKAAGLAALAAQRSAEAAALRQKAAIVQSTGATAQQIRTIKEHTSELDSQAKSLGLAIAKAREQKTALIDSTSAMKEQITSLNKESEKQVSALKESALALDGEANSLRLAAATAREYRDTVLKVNGATNQSMAAIENEITTLTRRASVLSAESSVRKNVAQQIQTDTKKEVAALEESESAIRRRIGIIGNDISVMSQQATTIRSTSAVHKAAAQQLKISLDNEVRSLKDEANALDMEAKAIRESVAAMNVKDQKLQAIKTNIDGVANAAEAGAIAFGALGLAGVLALKDSVDAAVAYENQVRLTLTQVDRRFKPSLEEIGEIGKRTASEYATAFTGIQPALFDVFSSTEANVGEAEQLLKAFAKAAVAGQTEIQAASRATIGLMNAYSIPFKDVNKVLDIQFQLVQEGVGTYEEWTDRIGLVTPSAVRAGQSIETMAASLATATRLGTSAARAGTAVARAFDAMSNPKTITNLEKMGVKVRDARGQMLPMVDIFEQWKTAIEKLPEKERVGAILDTMKGAGSTIEARRFVQNILLAKGGFDLFKQMVNEFSTDAGAFDAAYEQMSGTTAAQTQILVNNWQIMKESIGSALLPEFNKLVGMLRVGLEWFNKLPAPLKDNIATFVVFGTIIATLAATFFGFIAIIGLVVAGITSLGVVAAPLIAAFIAIPIAIAGMVAGFITLYQNSESFRSLISTIIEKLNTFKDIVVNTATSIKDSFEKNLMPPLEKLWTVIDTEVIPVLDKFVAMFTDEVMPKLEEAGRIVTDIADNSFKYLGEAIDKYLTPAISKVTEFFDEHKETLKPLIEIFGQVAKWATVIGVVLLAIPFGTIGTLIIGVVSLVSGLISAAISMYEFFKSAGETVAEFFTSTWNTLKATGDTIAQFFTSLWTGILDIIISVWNTIVDFINSGVSILRSIWEAFWSTFGGIVKAGWDVIVALFNLAVVLFIRPVQNALGFIFNLWKTIWNALVTTISVIWQVIKNVVTSVASSIWTYISYWLSVIKNAWQTIWEGIKLYVQLKFNQVRNLIGDILEAIKNIWNKYFSGFFNTVKDKFTEIVTKVSDGIQKVKDKFSGASGWLLQAGKDIMDGLIEGIENRLRKFKEVLEWITVNIPDWKGPKAKDLKLLEPTGGWLMDGLSKGIKLAAPSILNQLKNFTDNIDSFGVEPSFNVPTRFKSPESISTNPPKQIVNNFYITTNEIDPRKSAADLGWELAGRM